MQSLIITNNNRVLLSDLVRAHMREVSSIFLAGKLGLGTALRKDLHDLQLLSNDLGGQSVAVQSYTINGTARF